ncbi:MAG: hypothetical protein ACREOP_15515 [Thermodesulfobacteriota bacterium]
MKTLFRWLQFLRVVLAGWHQLQGNKPQPDDGAQTTAEVNDRKAWDKAKAEYERQKEQSDEEFWKEEKKN